MSKRVLWLAVSILMALSLILASCKTAPAPTTPTAPSTPAAPTTPVTPTQPTAPTTEKPQQETVKPASDKPQYGSTLRLILANDVTTFDPIENPTGGPTINLISQGLWAGDWTKGPAGSFGSGETDWRGQYDVWEHKAGQVAESTKWTIDSANNSGTIVYQIRRGLKYQINPASELSRRVAGRELTADDVASYLKRTVTESRAYLYRTNIDLRKAEISKTGAWEVSVKVPLDALITGIMRFGDSIQVLPPEQRDADYTKWQNTFGTGPFMISTLVPGSTIILDKNPDYWYRNPIGPGKGDQLPYVDKVQYIIVPDRSTRQAALRTSKIDQMAGYGWEDSEQMKKTTPALMNVATEVSKPAPSPESIDPPSDTPPFNDIRVRRAFMLATDFNALNKGLYNNLGQILTWPFQKTRGYEDLYLGLDDPDMPASVKELYTYNPEKAKQLLKEAGFPSGMKVKALMISDYVDFYSVIKDMWAKVGITLEFDVKENAVRNQILNRGDYKEGFSDGGVAPVSVFHSTPTLTGTPSAPANTSRIFDARIDDGLKKVRTTILANGMKPGMKEMRELLKYVLDQAYAIPVPYVPLYNFWWPWLKNYSGETTVGYFEGNSWAQFIWIDRDLKKSMGY